MILSSAPLIEDRIYNSALNNDVLVSKGSWFDLCEKQPGSIQFRLTHAPEEEID